MRRLQPTLDALRKQGFKVRCTHYRYAFVEDSPVLIEMRKLKEWRQDTVRGRFNILPNGGKVVVVITAPDGREVKAESNCSLVDNFVRRIGTSMAFGRALKVLVQQGTTKAILG